MDAIEEKRREEIRVVGLMIRVLCEKIHKTGAGMLCKDCQELLEYVTSRILNCPRMKEKTFCSVCSTNCYAPARREQVRQVMHFSGPRMLLRFPIASLRHKYYEWKYKRER